MPDSWVSSSHQVMVFATVPQKCDDPRQENTLWSPKSFLSPVALPKLINE